MHSYEYESRKCGFVLYLKAKKSPSYTQILLELSFFRKTDNYRKFTWEIFLLQLPYEIAFKIPKVDYWKLIHLQIQNKGRNERKI